MKKRFFTTVLAVGLLIPLFADASEFQQKESIITTEYTINSDIAPDTVKIKFYVESQGINLADIKEKNDKIVSQAINEIKKKLSQNESIKTTAFRVNNIYSYKDKVRIFQKYQVTNGFEVKLKEMNKISEIIKIAIDNGINKVDSLNFSIEDGQNICNELMGQAIVAAKKRAIYLSHAADASLDKVKNINPYCSLNNSFVRQTKYYTNSSINSESTDAAASSIDVVEPGLINVKASVNMTYYLK